jgi:putative ABC transport system permease protein
MKRFPFSALTRKSLADVTRRKGRTVLVVLGILIGVFGLTAINVAAGGLANAFAYSASKTATDDIDLAVQSVDPSLVSALRAVPNVKTVQFDTFYSTRWQIAAAPGHVNMTIVSYPDLDHVQLNPFQLSAGRLPGPGEIVMESSDRGLQNVEVGDTVTVSTPYGPQQLRVVGLARTLGLPSAAFQSRARAYMSEYGLRALSGISSANDIQLQVNDKGRAKQTVKDLQAVLAAHHVVLLGAAIDDNNFDPGPVNGIFTIMRVLSFIALLLTSFLIINTVTTLVAEQTKVIGTMKALGGGRGTIMRGYLTSVAIYSVVGTVLGLGLGILGGYAFTAYLTTIIILDPGPYQVDVGVVLVSALVGLGIPFAAAFIPLWTGTRITVREAMAAYGVSASNGRTTRRTFGRGVGWVSQTTQLGLRGVFRRRGRAVLTLLALTLSGTAFLAIQTTTYSVNSFIGVLFAQYDADAFVNTLPQPYPKIRAELLSVPNVARVERFEQSLVKTKYGQLVLTGTEPDPVLYHFQLVSGRLLNGDEPGALLISDNMANKTGLKVGDTLELSSATNTETWFIVGEVHDLNGGTGVIGTAFTTVDALHTFTGLPTDIGSSFMIGGSDRSPAAVNTMANALDDQLSAQGLAPSVTTAQQQIDRNRTQFQILYVLLYAVAAIVALVGVLGLFNTLTTSVLERRREIGILRSMGATGWRVASIFWTEGLTLAGISWLIAALVGIPAAYGFVMLLSDVLITVPFSFSPASFASMLVVIVVIATLASVIPALSAARVRIADTLRYE